MFGRIRFLLALILLSTGIYNCTERDFNHPFGYDSNQEIIGFSLTSHKDTVLISWNSMRKFVFDSLIVERTSMEYESGTEKYFLSSETNHLVDLTPIYDISWTYSISLKYADMTTEVLISDSIITGPFRGWACDGWSGRIFLLSYDFRHIWKRFSQYLVYPQKIKPLADGELFVYDRFLRKAFFFHCDGNVSDIDVSPGNFRDMDFLDDDKRLIATGYYGGIYILDLDGDTVWSDDAFPSMLWLEVQPNDQSIYGLSGDGRLYFIFKSDAGLEMKEVYHASEGAAGFCFPDTSGLFLLDYDESIVYFNQDRMEESWEIRNPRTITYDWKNNTLFAAGKQDEYFYLYRLESEGGVAEIKNMKGYPSTMAVNPRCTRLFIGDTVNGKIIVCSYDGKSMKEINNSFLSFPVFLYMEH